MNATWTVKVERLEIQLSVGIHAEELDPQPVWVSLGASGTAPASPNTLAQCFDYEPLCRWLLHEWPKSPHTPLLETRIDQLLAFAFGLDARLHTVSVGLYKQRMSLGAVAVGIERQATRLEFEAQRRSAATGCATPVFERAAVEKESHAAHLP